MRDTNVKENAQKLIEDKIESAEREFQRIKQVNRKNSKARVEDLESLSSGDEGVAIRQRTIKIKFDKDNSMATAKLAYKTRVKEIESIYARRLAAAKDERKSFLSDALAEYKLEMSKIQTKY
jgi:hypothetical protein